MCREHRVHVGVRGQLAGVGSFLKPCGLLGSNSGHQGLAEAVLYLTGPSLLLVYTCVKSLHTHVCCLLVEAREHAQVLFLWSRLPVF